LEEAKPQILLWAVPECPCRVTIAAPVINEIRILAVEAFYSVPRGGVEIGGVFFGMREPDALHIRAHRPIPCQYSTGPSFTLSVKDQLGLSGLLDEAPADPALDGMIPLGWYHSHTRSELFLSAADLQLYSEFFPERWQVALVLKPTNLQPTRAGFFFRDRFGAVKSDAPVQEFKLEPPGFGLEALDQDPALHVVPSQSAPGPEVRIYYSPLTNEIPRPALVKATRAPVPVSEPSVPPEPLPIATAAVPPEPPPEPPPAATAPASPVAEVPTVAPVVEAPVPKVAQPVLELVRPPVPPVRPEIGIPGFLAESRRKPRNTGWIWALLGIILLCGGGGAAVLKWGRLAKPTDLGLETYDINGAFLIRWDRESPLIRTATQATLEIQDGGEKTPIPLSPAELAVGGYGYIRRTGQVSVHMKVDGATPAEEYSNFNNAQSLGSQQNPTSPAESVLAQALAEKEHLKTELINESMQSLELRRQITDLHRQLAEERAKGSPSNQ
jgi:hypothetical protein